VAILGCGRIAARHRRTIGAVDGSVQVSFASRDAARAAEFARRNRGRKSWGSYAGAIADASVQAVLIATPPVNHLELTLSALAGGKHVIVEKPAFLHAADVASVDAAAALAQRQVLVAENYCYKPLTGVLRSIITSGELGDVRFVAVHALKDSMRPGWRADPAVAGGGALFEGGVHWLHLMAELGLTIESAQGFRPGSADGLERSTLVVIRYAEGPVGSLHHSWETPARFRGLQLSRIAGTRGGATFESNGIFVFVRGATRSRWVFPGLRDIEGYRAMFRDFIGALRGTNSPRMTLARARRDLELVEAATSPAQWHEAVAIPGVP
jgi:UDP-N-acetylglucosamine 3-dehydrogenase